MLDQGGIVSCIESFGMRLTVRLNYLLIMKRLGRLDRPQHIAIQGPLDNKSIVQPFRLMPFALCPLPIAFHLFYRVLHWNTRNNTVKTIQLRYAVFNQQTVHQRSRSVMYYNYRGLFIKRPEPVIYGILPLPATRNNAPDFVDFIKLRQISSCL